MMWRQAFSSLSALCPAGPCQTALLLHAEVTHPKLGAEPYEREYGITVYDTELVTLMHDRYYCLILKLVVVSYLAASLPSSICCCCRRRRGLVLMPDIFSIRFSLSIGPNLNMANIVMI